MSSIPDKGTKLVRGSACLPCRKKRMKCDTARPACTQCQRARRHIPCVYPTRPTATALLLRAEELGDEISRLQDNKAGKDHDHSISSSIPATDPLCRKIPAINHAVPEELVATPPDWINGEPPEPLRQFLLGIFVRYRHHLFFRSHLRLLDALDLPSTHPDAIHPCLVNAIYLTGCHFSRNLFGVHEGVFLARVRHHLNQSLAMADRLFHFILASTILSKWYLCSGRPVEAHHQSAAVAHFASCCGLDQISSPWLADAPKSLLGPPRDAIDLGDRVNAFWGILAADKTTSLASGLPCTLLDHKVATIWPMPSEQFSNARSVQPGSVSTLFSLGDTSLSRIDDDPFTLTIKAVILLDRSARLGARVRLEEQHSGCNRSATRADMLTLETGIVELISTLRAKSAKTTYANPVVGIGDGSAVEQHRVSSGQSFVALKVAPMYTLTTLHGALMQLHRVDASHDPWAYARMVATAEKIAEIAQTQQNVEVAKFGSAVGLTWTVACDVLVQDAQRMKLDSLGHEPNAIGQRREQAGWILTAFQNLSWINPLYETSRVRLNDMIKQL